MEHGFPGVNRSSHLAMPEHWRERHLSFLTSSFSLRARRNNPNRSRNCWRRHDCETPARAIASCLLCGVAQLAGVPGGGRHRYSSLHARHTFMRRQHMGRLSTQRHYRHEKHSGSPLATARPTHHGNALYIPAFPGNGVCLGKYGTNCRLASGCLSRMAFMERALAQHAIARNALPCGAGYSLRLSLRPVSPGDGSRSGRVQCTLLLLDIFQFLPVRLRCVHLSRGNLPGRAFLVALVRLTRKQTKTAPEGAVFSFSAPLPVPFRRRHRPRLPAWAMPELALLRCRRPACRPSRSPSPHRPSPACRTAAPRPAAS